MTVESGPTEEVLRRPYHPYTAALLGARPVDAVPGQPLANIPGAPPPPSAWGEGCRFAPRCPFATADCEVALPALREIAPGRRVACVRAEELSL
jgi:oligopeptide/dipeptide ABC transporter ATP-binding protein